MHYSFLGTYKDYNVYKGPRSKDDVPYHDPGNIYLVPTGDGNYWMVLNGRICGTCDSRYCIEEFYEPPATEVQEVNFTATVSPDSWTDRQATPAEEPVKCEESTPTDSDDFWTRIQREIDITLKNATI